jgi:hypothetical protein
MVLLLNGTSTVLVPYLYADRAARAPAAAPLCR